MKLLLHTCCAPCSIYCIEELKKDNIVPNLFWYNPNIHPYTEYEMRKQTLEKYSQDIGLKLIIKDEYGLKEFVKNVVKDLANRCEYCYFERLQKTVLYAKENNYDAFSTTLLISPYQKHEKIKQIGEDLEKETGIKFLYKDFRIGFRDGQNKAKELEMYKQKYCGCIFSKENV